MNRVLIPLEDVRVASPCHAKWEVMEGKGNCRFCLTCAKNVYNLSDMTRFDAELFMDEREGEVCVRYYQRADGMVLTQDCPVGLRKLRNAALVPLARIGVGVAALLAYSVWGFGSRSP